MEVFLSHPSEKLNLAWRVYRFTEELRVPVWFDKKKLIGGQDWNRVRDAAQRKADQALLLCSKETFSRPGVIQREIKDILARGADLPLGSSYLVPLRTKPVAIPDEISKYQYIDLFEGDWRQALALALHGRYMEIGETPPRELTEYVVRSSGDRESIDHATYTVNENRGELSAQYFQYNRNEPYWQYINADVISRLFEDAYLHRPAFQERPLENDIKTDFWWNAGAEEFFREGELVSYRIFTNCFTGGAHPNTWIVCRNFGGEKLGPMDFREMFQEDQSLIRYLKSTVEADYRFRYKDSEDGSSLWWPENDDDLWSTLNNYSFDSGGITFSFPPYSLAPYAEGIIETFTPWKLVKHKINPRFLSGDFGELIQRS